MRASEHGESVGQRVQHAHLRHRRHRSNGRSERAQQVELAADQALLQVQCAAELGLFVCDGSPASGRTLASRAHFFL